MRGPATLAFVVALALRLVFIAMFPANIGLDGFQRWAARDHLLVQGWLPAAQSVVWVVAKLGGSVVAARVAFAVVGSVAVGAGAAFTTAVAGRPAGWAFVLASAFSPFLLWSTALYQEGTFLLFLFGGLALAARGRTVVADLVIGAVALVRYEGWPLLGLYVVWRRDPRALLCAWGVGAWLAARALLPMQPFLASPVDYFEDWSGLVERFSASAWKEDAWRLSGYALLTGTWGLAIPAVLGAWVGRTNRGVAVATTMAVFQLGVVALWIVGLGQATHRMLAIVGMLASVPAAHGVAWALERLRPGLRPVLVVPVAILGGAAIANAWFTARLESAWTRHEREAVVEMEECPECTWWIVPRDDLGPKHRHDSCEMIQGVSELRHGVHFRCAAWPADAPYREECHGTVKWNGHGYRVSQQPGSGPR